MIIIEMGGESNDELSTHSRIAALAAAAAAATTAALRGQRLLRTKETAHKSSIQLDSTRLDSTRARLGLAWLLLLNYGQLGEAKQLAEMRTRSSSNAYVA